MSFDKLLAKPFPLRHFNRNEGYFNGKKRLDALGVSIPPEMRVLEIIVDWPRIAVEALEERLTVEGFTLSGETGADDRYEKRWQANRLDLNSSLLHTESLVQGLGYAVIGQGDQYAQISCHSARGFSVAKNPITGVVTEAVQQYKDDDGDVAIHYEPKVNTIHRKKHGRWLKEKEFDSGTEKIPVVPFVNRARLSDHNGRSEMEDVLRFTDAASRSITNLQVATELVALPQRYMLGAQADSFKDENGDPVPQWETYIGRILTGPKEGKVGTLPGADLQQIISTVRLYAGFVAASTGLSLMSLGVSSDANPASADALNAVDNRHVRRAEKKQTLFGEPWEDVQRIADEIEGVSDPASMELETRWRPASTMTLDAVSDAAVGLVGAGIVPPVVARDIIGLTSEQKKIAAEYDDNSTSSLLKSIGV